MESFINGAKENVFMSLPCPDPENCSPEPITQFQDDAIRTLDSKVRFVLPAKFRRAIERRNPGLDMHYIFIGAAKQDGFPYVDCFDAEGWKRHYTEYPAHMSATLKIRQGRLLLPEKYREHAQLTKPGTQLYIAATSARDGFQVWNHETHETWAESRKV